MSTWTLVGSVGGPGFGAVDPAGRVMGNAAVGARWSVAWWIGADDRWHVPPEEPSLRQRLAAPGVVETRVAVPSGDAVQRVYGVGGPDDLAVVEVENESPLPFALALALEGDPPVVFSRPPFPLDAPPRPAGNVVQFPVAHRASVRFAVSLTSAPPAAVDVAGLPSAAEVGAAWRRHLDAGVRVEVPALKAAVDAARAALLLFDDGVEPRPAPWTGGRPADAVAVLAAMERWGFARQAAELAPAVARRHRRRHAPPVLEPGEAMARVDALLRDASPTFAWGRASGEDWEGHHGARVAEFLLAVRDLLVVERGGAIEVLPGFPEGWVGAPVEVHGAPVGRHVVSFALRWHGDRPALIWDVQGCGPGTVRVSAPALDPGWSTVEPKGETLLAAPPRSPAAGVPRAGAAGS